MVLRGDDEILVIHVDDDRSLLDLAASALERQEDVITVESSTDPEAVCAEIDGREVDCVVTDYQMPPMNGLELLSAVRDHHPRLPVLLFTGEGSEEIASEAISAGVTDYLQKRSGLEQYELLANRIVDAVERYRTERRLELYREIVENTTDAVIVKDLDGRYQLVNEPAEALFDRDREAIVGRTDEAVLGSEVATRVRRRERQVVESETIETDDERIEYPGGPQVSYETTRIPYRDRSGDVVGTIGIVRPLSDGPASTHGQGKSTE